MVFESSDGVEVVAADSWKAALDHVRRALDGLAGPYGHLTVDILAGEPYRSSVGFASVLTDRHTGGFPGYWHDDDRVSVQFRTGVTYGPFTRPNARIDVHGYRSDGLGGFETVDAGFWIAVCPDGVPLGVHETAQVLLWDADRIGEHLDDADAYESAAALARTAPRVTVASP